MFSINPPSEEMSLAVAVFHPTPLYKPWEADLHQTHSPQLFPIALQTEADPPSLWQPNHNKPMSMKYMLFLYHKFWEYFATQHYCGNSWLIHMVWPSAWERFFQLLNRAIPEENYGGDTWTCRSHLEEASLTVRRPCPQCHW